MQFCINGTGFGGWQDDGIDPCLYGTLAPLVPFTYILIVRVLIALTLGRKKSDDKPDVENPQVGEVYEDIDFGEASWICYVRLVLGNLLVLECAVRGVLLDMMNGYVVGQQILTVAITAINWITYLSAESSKVSIKKRKTTLTKWLLSGFLCLILVKEALALVSWFSPHYWWSIHSVSARTEFGLWVIRVAVCLLLMLLKVIPPVLCAPKHHLPVDTDEKIDKQKKKEERKKSTWSNVFIKLRMMLPYVWPKGNRAKQGLVFVCVLMLALGRVANLFVPIVSKTIIDSLTTKVIETPNLMMVYDFVSPTPSGMSQPSNQTSDPLIMDSENKEVTEIPPIFCWQYILLYCFLMFLKGGGAGHSGMLNNLRSLCWVPVQQYTSKHVQLSLFHHLQSLSLRWHLHRQTGEVLKIVDRGTNSINMLLSHLLFNVLPIIVDITIAIVFFVSSFNYIFGLIVFFCMVTYVGVSIMLTEWRTKYRRDMNKLDNEKNAKAVDALLNFETVKYYGAADFEKGQYKEAIVKYQKAEFVSTCSLHLLNIMQNVVITCGMITGTVLCGWGVAYSIKGQRLTVGDYVLFGTYISQLYGPIQWLGNYYRMIQAAFVDMENMFDLFKEPQEVKDVPNAPPLEITKGEIEFRDVSFHYDPRKPILKNVSFCVPPGHTYALVGHSGGGKSTVVRLLFRFYDVIQGSILIDGKDISQVQQESLRKSIGVVPQDIVMFNNNIKYNIRYGRVTATEDEIREAAEAADIDDRILTFPNQYDTLVGERGLKLSGGEKQRVAIARTILKSPAVILLDEATSALDTKTERNIQNSLLRVCDGRTTLVVAHRLSTIIHADKILVLEEGRVVETGSHKELLNLQGIYADMWKQQLTSRETTPEIEKAEV